MDYTLLLPCELIHTIAQQLDVRSFGRWRLVCTGMAEMLDDEHLWKILYRRDIVDGRVSHGPWREEHWDEDHLLQKGWRHRSYKDKIAYVLHPYPLGTEPYYPKQSQASSFYALLKHVTWITYAETLKVCVLTITGRKYVFLVGTQNWNHTTNSTLRLDLLLLDTDFPSIVVQRDWIFEWIPPYRGWESSGAAPPSIRFSREQTPAWISIPTQPEVPPMETLCGPPPANCYPNPFYKCGNALLAKEVLSVRLLDIPAYKLRASAIRISQNYRFLVTLDDYKEVLDYLHETADLI